jgi:hypothetical protein
MRFSRRHLAIGAASLAAAAIAMIVGLWLGVPAALRWGIETVAAREIGRPIQVGEIRFNPFKLQLEVRDLSVGGSSGEAQPLLSLGELHAQISVGSVWRLAPIVKSLRLQTIRVNVARLEANRFNFSDIIERLAAKPSDGEPARFSVNNIELVDGAIGIDDRVVGRKHAVTEIGLGIPFISSLPDAEEIKVMPSFSARVNDTPFRVDGETLPFADSLETSVTIRLTGLHLPTYLGYVPVPLKFTLSSGALDTDLRIAFRRAVAAQKDRPAQPARLLLTGRAAIRDLALLPDGMQEPVAEWRALEVALDEIEPLARTAKIGSVTLTAPVLRATRRSDGAIAGLGALEVAPLGGGAAGKAQAAPFRVEISQIRLADGTVHVRDEMVDFSRTVRSIAVEVDGFSTAGKAPAQLTVSALTDDEARLKLAGELRAAPLQVAIDATLESLPLTGLAPYLRLFTTATVSGELSLDARVQATQTGNDIAVEVAEGRLKAGDVQIKGPRGKLALVSAPQIEVSGIGVDVQQRSVNIERATVTGAQAKVGRLPDGRRLIDWQALIVDTPPQASADPSPPWSMKLDQLELVNARLQVLDQAVRPTVTLAFEALDAVVRNVTSDLGNRIDVKLRTRLGEGTAQASGWLRPQPLEAELKLDVVNVDVSLLQPYAASYANAVLSSAVVSADGMLAISVRDGVPVIRYDGNGRVTNFAALNPNDDSELARWQALALDAVRVDTGTQPPSLDIGGVKLNDFYARAILSPQGKLNLVEVFGTPVSSATQKETPPQAAPPSSATAELPVRIRIGGIEVLRSAVNFTDNFVKPNYRANLTDLSGTVTELSSDRPVAADVSIRGRGDLASLIEITGKINPLATPLALDLRGSTKDVELPRLTPYSVKYAGLPITKGKLSMDVHYKIENNKLQAENHLFLEQLTFGERVESPTATELPVQLAVSLLQNSRGEIDISLPVSGSLDNPEFSIGSIIGKAVVNLLTKIITAPFTALSAAFGGGGDDLGHVAFDPGAAALPEAELKKLDTLAKALNDRPALQLNIAGHSVAATDAEALRRAKFDAKLRAAKVQELGRAGQGVDPKSVTVATGERERLIGRIYEAESIPDKPRNFLGMAKSIPAAEMEQLIMKTVTADEEDLRELAIGRATAVRDYLSEKGKVPRDRLFLGAPLLDGSGDAKLPPARVDFSLK